MPATFRCAFPTFIFLASPDHNRSGYAIMSALLGGVFWAALFVSFLAGNAQLGVIELLLLLAILVFVPLGLDLAVTPDAQGNTSSLFRLARFAQPFGALAAAGAFLVPAGPVSGSLATGWTIVTTLMALFGLERLLRRRTFRPDELCIDMALLYLPVGGVWLLVTRFGWSALGFGGVIALLTAVHFHYAGFIAPVIAGMTGRIIRATRPRAWALYRTAALGIIAGPPLVALGITTSPAVEVVSAVVLALALGIHAGLLLFVVIPVLAAPRERWMLGIAACASAVAMILAVLYATGTFMQISIITIPQMAVSHGILNGLFALGGVLGWGIVRPRAG